MVKIPERKLSTSDALHQHYEESGSDWRRDHLGASLIGRECTRQLWYGFRWSAAPKFPGRVLRLFERGQREEEWLARDLRAIGVDLRTTQEDSEDQIRVLLFPHFGGSCDGVGLGFLEAPKTWHVWECKTSNAKQFAILKKQGVEKAKPEHYAQMQLYMHGLKLKRAFYQCVCKDNDEIHQERIHYDRAFAESLIAKADHVVFASEPLSKISENPTFYKCKWCDFAGICQYREVESLERNCRTCASVTCMKDGTWRCDHFQKTLTPQEQRDGCGQHLFIPKMLPWEPRDFDEIARAMTYIDEQGARVIDQGGELTVRP